MDNSSISTPVSSSYTPPHPTQRSRFPTPATQDFEKWLNENLTPGSLPSFDATVAAGDLCRFLPSSARQKYFNKPKVRDIFRQRPSNGRGVPIGTICSDYSMVLCTLLSIGRPEVIEHFLQHPDLQDSHLPFESRPTNFPCVETDPELWSAFSQRQWQFCTPIMKSRSGLIPKWNANTIFPFVYDKEPLGEGGSGAITRRIQIHPEYNNLAEPGNNCNNSTTSNRTSNLFALKEFKGTDAGRKCDVEAHTHRILHLARSGPNILTCYGAYQHENGESASMILEYADEGTLESYLQRVTPPRTPVDVESFWTSYWQLVLAFRKVHCVEGEDQTLNGFHLDVTPKNILVCSNGESSPYKFTFKLADFGLSKWREKHGDTAIALTSLRTRTYGAPESHIANFGANNMIQPIPVSPKVDIFGFGCITSEVMTWLIFGYSDVRVYREKRMAQLNELDEDYRGHDLFHNGSHVLSSVLEHHEHLLGSVRRNDELTPRLIREVLPHMIDDERRNRFDANVLWSVVSRILKQHKEKSIMIARNSASAATPDLHHHSQSFGADIDVFGPQQGYTTPAPSTLPYRQRHLNVICRDQFSSATSTAQPSEPYGRTIDPSLGGSVPMSNSHQGTYSRRSQQWTLTQPINENFTTSIMEQSHSPQVSRLDQQMPSPQSSHYPFPESFPSTQNPPRTAVFHDIPQPTISPPSHLTALSKLSSLNQSSYPFDHRTDVNVLKAPPKETLFSTLTRPIEAGIRFSRNSEARAPPRWSVQEALEWREMCRQGNKHSLPNYHLANELNNRDFMLLIDDSTSMRNYWKDVAVAVDLFGYIGKTFDRDGVDLQFASQPSKNTETTATKLKRLVEQHHPSKHSISMESLNNISLPLESILSKYRKKVEKASQTPLWPRTRAPKKLTLLILTDGVWQPKTDARYPIQSLVSVLTKHDCPIDQAGVQFIRFGNNPDGANVLDNLDAQGDLPRDIVDHEPWLNGNVWKMLLGATNKWIDQDYDA